MGLFKSGDELFEKAIDLVKQRNFSDAKEKFSKSLEKLSKENKGDTTNAKLCRLNIAAINLANNPSSLLSYENFRTSLKNNADLGTFEFGLTTVDMERAAKECDLIIDQTNAENMSGDASVRDKKGRELIQIGQRWQMEIGDSPLVVFEIATGDTTTTGTRRGFDLIATGYENIASATVLSDPKQAAEYLQNAVSYRQQIGEDGAHDLGLIQSYSKTAKCWICGRVVTGETIHFVTMSSEITPLMKSSKEGLLDSATESMSSIYACRACYSAISRRADAIANDYHMKSIQEIRNVEARLQAEISSLQSEINSLRLASR